MASCFPVLGQEAACSEVTDYVGLDTAKITPSVQRRREMEPITVNMCIRTQSLRPPVLQAAQSVLTRHDKYTFSANETDQSCK